MKPRRGVRHDRVPHGVGQLGDDGPEIRLVTDGRDPARASRCGWSTPTAPTSRPARVGEFLVRGPQRALGYLDPQHTADGFDADGWFRSGDLGFVDAERCITVTGRTKDIINRGGEKLSAQEIEASAAASSRRRPTPRSSPPRTRVSARNRRRS